MSTFSHGFLSSDFAIRSKNFILIVITYRLFVFAAHAEPIDLTRFTLTFEDNFGGGSNPIYDTTLDLNKWQAAQEARQNQASAWDPALVSVGDGVLKLRISKVVDPTTGAILRYDCGAVRGRVDYGSNYKFRQKYGYYEARYKLPARIDKDYWASFWLMAGPVTSTTDTRIGMEIDIMESFTLARTTHTANFHWGGYGINHNKASIPLNSPTVNWAKNTVLNPAGQFHVYGFYWDEEKYIFYLDGQVIGETDMKNIGSNVQAGNPTHLAQGTAQSEGYMLFSCEAAPWAGLGGWEVDAPASDVFEVDYVKVYDLKPVFTSNPVIGNPATENTSYQATLAGSATDANGVVKFAKVSGPSWLSVAADGTLSGTPSSGNVGVNSFVVSVNDNISTVESDLNINVRSFFNQWTSDDSLTFSGDGNSDAIPDGLAWLLGASIPSENAKNRLPSFARSTEGGLVVNFRCLKTSKRGAATLSLQFSSDLGISDPWSNHQVAIPETSGTDSGTGVIFTITEDGDYYEVQATIPANVVGEGGKLFSRLMATGAP